VARAEAIERLGFVMGAQSEGQAEGGGPASAPADVDRVQNFRVRGVRGEPTLRARGVSAEGCREEDEGERKGSFAESASDLQPCRRDAACRPGDRRSIQASRATHGASHRRMPGLLREDAHGPPARGPSRARIALRLRPP
jgi:hypothetical protein